MYIFYLLLAQYMRYGDMVSVYQVRVGMVLDGMIVISPIYVHTYI